jgi:hypothetical protein
MQKINVDLSGIVGLNATLAIAETSELIHLKKNARYIKQEKFQQLKENIAEDKGLTSVPLVSINEGGGYDIISGNHHVKAAAIAGQKQVLVLCVDEPITPEKKVAIQLAHNSLEGQDNTQILKSLYEELSTIDLKKYAGIDESVFAELEKLKAESMSGDPLRFKAVTIMFLPEEIIKVKDTFDKIKKGVIASDSWLAAEKDYDKYLDGMEIIKSTYDVKNTAIALSIIMENFEKTFDVLKEASLRIEEDTKRKKRKSMPLIPLFDTYNIPIETGRKLDAVMRDAISSAKINQMEKYKLLDILIEAYWKQKKESNTDNSGS